MSNSTSVRSTFLVLAAAQFDAFEARVSTLGKGDRLPMDEATEIAGASVLDLAKVAYDSVAPGLLTVTTRGRAPSIHLSMTDEEKKAAIKVAAKDRAVAAKAAAEAKDKRIAELEARLAAQAAPTSTGLATVEWTDSDLTVV